MKRRKPFPRLMWADHDPTCKHMPVAVYSTKSEQQSNRPDLKPIRVRVSLVNGAGCAVGPVKGHE